MDFVSNDIKTEGVVKIRIDAVGGDLDRVACRYPASFLNEMARQLTSAIEAATGVTGVAESSEKGYSNRLFASRSGFMCRVNPAFEHPSVCCFELA